MRETKTISIPEPKFKPGDKLRGSCVDGLSFREIRWVPFKNESPNVGSWQYSFLPDGMIGFIWRFEDELSRLPPRVYVVNADVYDEYKKGPTVLASAYLRELFERLEDLS